ncbi:ornithine cyclodeaminase [Niveomyces insectorum RCEF 264]|uniref:Ornithine cyclodeaminase n=1 Tax=Niveomyces insectorum RCEF 264 TaxID=1081102 RepID=A0A167ZYN4_9HYPO|nr:ornithine cyclodeaminase [Niveomyces insectorum RCEF 264]
MSLTILTDEQIAGLLNGLTVDELESFRDALKQSLYEYSTGTQSLKDGDYHQPPRTSMTSPTTGATTLFMPSCSADGIGMKAHTEGVVPANPHIRPTGAITLYARTGNPLGILHASTLTAFRTALASACLLLRRDTVRDITVFGCGEQAYWHVRLALLLRGDTIRHINIISRHFDSCRQFLARFYSLPQYLKEREGWPEVKFSALTKSYNEYPRLLSQHLRQADVVFCCTPSTTPLFDAHILTSHEGRRKGRLLVAIGSYTHEMRELPADLLRQATQPSSRNHRHYHKHAMEGGVVVVDTLDGALKEAGEIYEAGLTPRHLVELGELVMLSRIALQDDDDNGSEDTSSTSTLSVPSTEFDNLSLSGTTASAMSSVYGQDGEGAETGRSRSRPSSPSRKSSAAALLGNLAPSGHYHRRSSSHTSLEQRKKKENHSARWLQRGNVIYKSVGLGLMDLAVGLHLIEFARQKGVGTYIDGF